MGAYNVTGAASLVSGQSEDVSQILANFNLIATVINGGIDNSNINAAAAILASKLAGYPTDGAKFLAGDGTWKVVTTTSSTNAQVGTTYTLAIGDANNIVEVANAGAITVTIPLNATVAFPVGTVIHVVQTGAGQITIAAAGGVTLNSTPGLKIAAQWGVVTLLKRATDTWLAFGNLTP